MRRKRRFGYGSGYGHTPAAVLESTGTQSKRRTKCAGCAQHIEVGEQFTRLRLRKRFRSACTGCGRAPKGAKRFHPACVPTDRNAAMGYDPNAHANRGQTYYCRACGHSQQTDFGTFCPNCGKNPRVAPANGGAVPPPPKPKSSEELTLEAVAKLEEAFIARIRQGKKAMPGHRATKAGESPCDCDVCSEFKKFQGIKGRILRPGTPGEEVAATIVGLQRIVKLVLS